MKYLKKFESFPGDNYTLKVKSSGEKDLPDGNVYDPNISVKNKNQILIYNEDWKKFLPKYITIIYKGNKSKFKKANIMLIADMVEISYESVPENHWGEPDCLEFDLYFTKDNNSNKIRINIDITYGDLMACEFSIESPNKVKVIQHTTYNSKFDRSNTVFALEDESLEEFVKFLNRFDDFKLTTHDLRFLDKHDNWPS